MSQYDEKNASGSKQSIVPTDQTSLAPPPYGEPCADFSLDYKPPKMDRKVDDTRNTKPIAPPSGFRIAAATTTNEFPPPEVLGVPPCYELDGRTPVYFGSVLFPNSVHPCKVGRHLGGYVSVGYGGVEKGHEGRYDILPFDPETMELVPASLGRIPNGRRPVEGGYEENGARLFHAVGVVQGASVPGKTGEHLRAANVSYGGLEISVSNYFILCWK